MKSLFDHMLSEFAGGCSPIGGQVHINCEFSGQGIQPAIITRTKNHDLASRFESCISQGKAKSDLDWEISTHSPIDVLISVSL
jgi:hypothetical protein